MSRPSYQSRLSASLTKAPRPEEKAPEKRYSGVYRALQDFSVFFGNMTIHYKTGDVIVSGAQIKHLLDTNAPIVRDEDTKELLRCPHCGHSFYQN